MSDSRCLEIIWECRLSYGKSKQRGFAMTNKINLTRISLIGAGLLAAAVLFTPYAPSAAQGSGHDH